MTQKQQKQAPAMPAIDWQNAALQLAHECAQRLQERGAAWIRGAGDDPDWRQAPVEASVYHWLCQKRRLSPETILQAMLGFNPEWREVAPGQRLAPGVTIPCLAGPGYPLQYVKVRLTKAAAAERGRSYELLAGGNPGALYGALPAQFGHRYLVLVAQELDALLLGQVAGDLAAAVTTGDPEVTVAPAWLACFPDLELVFDNCRNRAPPEAQAMPPGPRSGQDLAEWAAAGGDLRAWVERAIRQRWLL